MMKSINEFRGNYRWLSNFWPAQVELDGVIYPSVEHAYQAAKSLDENGEREPFQWGTAGEAKRRGRRLKIRPGWDDMKMNVMGMLLRQKFKPGSELAAKLIATGEANIEEGNTWGDKFWGVCDGEGENNLGKLLMLVRRDLIQGAA